MSAISTRSSGFTKWPRVQLTARFRNPLQLPISIKTVAWVRAEDEGEIRKVFEQARSVRKLGGEPRELADAHFFETLLRTHRAGEGPPFRGLQPAGRDLGPAVPAADKALENGSIEQVETLLADAIRNGVHKHFDAALGHRKFDPDDVEAYVRYVSTTWSGYRAPHRARHINTRPGFGVLTTRLNKSSSEIPMTMSACSIHVRPYFIRGASTASIRRGAYAQNRSELLKRLKRMPTQSRKPTSAMVRVVTKPWSGE